MVDNNLLHFEDYKNKKEEPKVKCAHCGKYIGMHKKKCPHCGIHFRGEAFQFKHSSEHDYTLSKNKTIKVLALMVLIILISISIFVVLYTMYAN